MIFNWPQPEKWYELNEEVHRRLRLSSDVTVRCYQGLPHAVFEIAQGTASFLSHRRAVGLLTGNTPFISGILPFLYKESFEVQLQSILSDEVSLTNWSQQLKKDTSFVLMNEDHPLSGVRYELGAIDESLNQRKIHSFRIGLSLPRESVKAYSVQIIPISAGFSIAICGAKFKSPVQFSQQLSFSKDEFLKSLESFLKIESDQSVIQNFEKSLPPGYQAVLNQQTRIWDRALICHPELNAEAIQKYILSNSQYQPEEIWPITSCAQAWTDWSWWEDRPNDDVLRGLLVVSVAVARDPNLKILLGKAISACQI